MAKTPNRMKDADEFSTFTNGQFIRKKSDGTGLESAPGGGTEVNDLTAAVTWANVPNANITQSSVTQHTAAIVTSTSVNAAGALMESEVDADIKTLSLPASTTISTFGASLVDDADAATARATLGTNDAGNLTAGTLSTARIAANALNFDKIEQVAEARILGRRAGVGPGNIEEMLPSEVKAVCGYVSGPVSATPDHLASFNAADGKSVTDSTLAILAVQGAIDHAAETSGNPHNVALGELLDGSFAELQEKLTDFQILLSTQTGEINALTLKGSPTGSDLIVIEDAAAGFAKKKAAFPSSASETNNLETVCTGILVDEVPVGSATDDVTYKPLVSGVLKYATGGAFSAAAIGDLMTAGSGISFNGSTLNVGAGTGVTVGTDDISVNYGTTSTTACVGNDARLKAPPKTVTVETPVSGNVILMGRSDRTLTIANVHGVIDSGNSVIVSLDSGASRAASDQQHVNAQTVNSTTTGNDLTKTANLTFDAGDWIWLTIGTVSGTVGSICITVSFT